MQSLTVVLLEGNAVMAGTLMPALSSVFSSVQPVQSLGELHHRIARTALPW